jgi:hypothetical protein
VSVRGGRRLAATLTEQRGRALLFRELATLRADAPIGADVDALRWQGPRPEFERWSVRLGSAELHERASVLAAARAAGTCWANPRDQTEGISPQAAAAVRPRLRVRAWARDKNLLHERGQAHPRVRAEQTYEIGVRSEAS